MNRRAFLGVLGVIAEPLLAEAQPAGKIARIGRLSPLSRSADAPFMNAFREGMRDQGWIEGRTFAIESRFAEGKPERLQGLASELLRLGVDVILAGSTTDGTKGLELLGQAMESRGRVAVLVNPTYAGTDSLLRALHEAGRALSMPLQVLEVRDPRGIESTFATIGADRPRALMVLSDPVMVTHRKRIVELAAKARLPAMYAVRQFVDHGGLMFYGASLAEMYRHAAVHVDRILKGAKPGDLPFEQPTRFELVINLKTARTLGLTIPPSLLQRADQVIE
jgi:putative tryptophan/tyrosine transport system substrate-binding protein